MKKPDIKWIMGKASLPEYKSQFTQFCYEIAELGVSSNSAKILFNRGIDTYEKVKRHLYLELNDTNSPTLFKDHDIFVDMVKRAIANSQKIIILGDYDVDGVSATAILMLALKKAGADVDFYINNRFVEGYGFKPESLDSILKLYPDVKTIITVDNGIVSFEAVKLAVDKGIEVLITDHHDPKSNGSLPNAHAVVNHKRHDCPYPFKDLSGAGVIFKMMVLLYMELDLDIGDVYDLLDILAVSTVADVVSLTDENRVFVKEGLRLIRNDHRLMFKILNELLNIQQIDEETIAFKYAPAMNAIGRLDGCPSDVVRALISDDEAYVRKICANMIEKNSLRREKTSAQVDLAEKMLSNEPDDTDVLIVCDESFDEGIVGLIAGKLCERYYKASIALTFHNGVIKGSARSTPELHIKKAMDYCEDLLEGYGGHAQAGGLSLKPENLNEFKKRINEYAKKILTDEDRVQKVSVDVAPLSPMDINGNTVDEIEKLKPYGQGFIKPLFGYKTPVFKFYENIKGDTLKLTGLNGIDIIGFDKRQLYLDLNKPKGVAVLGCPGPNVYNGNITYQFVIKDNNLKPCKNF